MRKRIPLAKIILKSIIRAADEYKSTYVLALFFLILQTAWSVWTVWTLIAVYQRFTPGAEGAGSSASSASQTGLIVLVIFAYYWTSELIKALAYTSVAGVFGTWFYNASPSKVKGAALSSLRRCLTYSFGSLCFGSLILAVLDIIRAILQIIQQQESANGDMVGSILACVAGCLVGCIDWAITFFNRLAYTNIALYGNSFVTASKETWQLVKQKGIDALINDSLINTVWTFGSYAIGLGCGIFAYAYLSISNPSYVQQDGSYFSVVIFFAIGLGLNIALAMGAGTIGAGCTTMFVCLAEDSQIIAQKVRVRGGLDPFKCLSGYLRLKFLTSMTGPRAFRSTSQCLPAGRSHRRPCVSVFFNTATSFLWSFLRISMYHLLCACSLLPIYLSSSCQRNRKSNCEFGLWSPMRLCTMR